MGASVGRKRRGTKRGRGGKEGAGEERGRGTGWKGKKREECRESQKTVKDRGALLLLLQSMRSQKVGPDLVTKQQQ